MAPVLSFPYEPVSLHWAPDKKSNAEGIYCYCGKDKGPVILVHLVLYNLMDASPEQKYFRWKEEICKFIDDYWSYLLPEKEQSPTWNNTVASVLSVQNHIFHSGVEIKGASGWWTLIEKAPPDKNKKLKPKNKNIPKSGVPRPPGARKDKRQRVKGSPRKKTRFDETSSDDDFHTTAKPRLSSIPTTRIKSRQISFSSGSSLSSAGDLSDDSLDDEFWRSEDEEEVRPTVLLHGIPALIQHHFNPNQLDFSSGPIDYEHFFRLADLVDDETSSRVIQKVRKALNSVGGVLSLSGKKKRRRSSVIDIKHEEVEQILDQDHYVEEMSDLTEDDDDDIVGGGRDRGRGRAVSRSESESSTESGNSDEDDDEDDDEDASDDDDEDEDIDEHDSHLANLRNKAMAAKTAAGKRYNMPTSTQRKSSLGRRPSIVPPPTTGGKIGKAVRKSSLKPDVDTMAERGSAAATDAPAKPKKVTLSFSPAAINNDKLTSRKQKSGAGSGGESGVKASKTKSKSTSGRRLSSTTTSLPTAAAAPAPSHSQSTTSVSTSAPAPAPAPPVPAVPSQVEIQRQQEWHILQILEDAPKPLPTVAARFKRKLHLKRLKAFLHLPLFDLERYMRVHLQSPLDLAPLSKEIPPDPHELQLRRQREFEARVKAIDHTPYGSSFASRLHGLPTNSMYRRPWERTVEVDEEEQHDEQVVEVGKDHQKDHSMMKNINKKTIKGGRISPYTGKVLKDFIWRDYESRAVMMDLLDEIRARNGRPARMPWSNLGTGAMYGRATKKRKRGEHGQVSSHAPATATTTATTASKVALTPTPILSSTMSTPSPTIPIQKEVTNVHSASPASAVSPAAGLSSPSSSPLPLQQPIERAPIDYCYLRKEHLPQVNETLCRRFWPGIDMTDALQYPDYSVVVLYKRLVIGCAFMTPEGYITYVAVSAGWEKAGIGQFMLYHLIQAAEGKDITLHVSANNPAMIMYQKFGFKPEQFLIDFYKEYLPDDSTMCHNAFFVRLRR
ncbi:Cysteine-rich protein 2-binding protein [Actinomortierella wolfii]|nr:Cysteine-rich protein 2-binding protein [Actinomortierella wolfii]